MTVTTKNLCSGQAPGSEAAEYTAPANTKAVVTTGTFTNVDTVARTLTAYLVRSGGSATNANILIDAQIIGPGVCYVSPEFPGKTLGPGDAIHLLADTGSKVNFTIDGYEIT